MTRFLPAIGRFLVGRPGRLPDFLGLGAQKAGTTTLYELLKRHPEAFLPAEKEVQYFSRHHHRSLRWYAAKFAAAGSWHRVGEISPYYLFHPEAPARIAAALPDARLVVLLRDPVERAISGFFHAHRHGKEPLPIEVAFHAETERLRDAARALASDRGRHEAHRWHAYVARSRYEEQLTRYYARFPCERILIVRSEEFFVDPRSAWTRIQNFLGLSVMPPPDPLPRINVAARDEAKVSATLRARLRESLAPTYEAMRRDHGITWPDPNTGDARHAG